MKQFKNEWLIDCLMENLQNEISWQIKQRVNRVPVILR